jgi:CheY-like chemotaxis protein
VTTFTEEDRRKHRAHARTQQRVVARVLVADDNPACRLTLQTVLEAGGYRVDSAASAAEAVNLLDQCEYALVLSDLVMESPEAGLQVIAHARNKPYRPATAIVTTSGKGETGAPSHRFLVAPENLPEFLGEVAGLISARASRRLARTMRRAS